MKKQKTNYFLIVFFVLCVQSVSVVVFAIETLLHEIGHYLYARHLGIKDAKFTFHSGDPSIQFDNTDMTLKQHYYLVFTGVVVGLAIIVLAHIIYLMNNTPTWAAATMFCYLAGLVNLVPLIKHSDGARMLTVSLACTSGLVTQDNTLEEVREILKDESKAKKKSKNYLFLILYITIVVLYLILVISLWRSCPYWYKYFYRKWW